MPLRPKYTMIEIATHNKESDAWLVYNNKVYDMTTYIKKHPGALAIIRGLGKDATSIFDKANHSNRAKNIMKKYYIGDIK
jgi:cytochrome b involved in lipid metabolism